MDTKERLLGADFLRAAACSMVLLHHVALYMSYDGDLGWLEPVRVFVKIGGFGVSVFFVLSGFLLAQPFWKALDRAQAMPSLRTYSLRRAARILPGFWLALTLSFLASFTLFDTPFDPLLVLRYLSGLFLVSNWHWTTLFPVEDNGPLWSIGFEVTSYVLLPLCFGGLSWARRWIGGSWKFRLLWLAAIALVLLAHWTFRTLVVVDVQGRGWEYGAQGGAKLWMPRFNPFGFFAIFSLGSLAAGLQTQWACRRHLLFDGLAVGGILAMAWMLWRQNSGEMTADSLVGYGLLGIPYGFPSFPLAVATVLAVAPQSRFVGRLLDSAPARYLSTISFGIYLWHYLVLELIVRYGLPGAKHGTLLLGDVLFLSGLGTGITIVLAHVSFHLLEHPMMGWARRFEQRISFAVLKRASVSALGASLPTQPQATPEQ